MYILSLFLIHIIFDYSKMYSIAKEDTVYVSQTSSNPDYPYMHGSFLYIDICEYDLNDSYYKSDYNFDGIVKIGGSDLKFIQSGIKISPLLAYSDIRGITIEKSLTHYKVTCKTSSLYSLSHYYLYVIKNNDKGFVNICNLIENKDIELKKEINDVQYKEISFEFDFKSHFKSETYRIVIIEKNVFGIYSKIATDTITTSPVTLIIILIILGVIIVVSIVVFAFLLFQKKKNIEKNISDTPYNKNENDDYMQSSDFRNNELTPAPIYENDTPGNTVN